MEKSSYRKLAEKIDMTVQGAPKKDGDFSPAFLKYLETILTPEEAEVASFLSVEPQLMTGEQVAEKAGRDIGEIEQILERLAAKGAVLGMGGHYVLPILSFTLNVPQFWDGEREETLRADRLYQELFIREGYHRFYTTSAKGTPGRRTVPVDQSISEEQQVLSHEEICSFLDQATMEAMALIPCPCRSRTERLGIRECKDKYSVAACLFLGMPAMLAIERGWGRRVSLEEAGQYIDGTREQGLVMMTNNAMEMADGVVCFCCGCCCSTTRGITRWDNPRSFARSNFVARVSDECVACGTCTDRCIFKALSLPEGAEKAQIDGDRCMGCGVCTVTCPSEALRLERIEREPIYSSTEELLTKVISENEEAGQKRPTE